MALYSRTDNETQRRKVGATTELNSVTTDPGQDPEDQPQAKVIDGQYVYIDDTEATIPSNKSRGLTAPGWWKYRTYIDAAGNTRHKAEHLVAFNDAPATPSDTDDNVAADASFEISWEGPNPSPRAFAPYGGITGLSYPAADNDRVEGAYLIEPGDYTTSGDGIGATFTVYVNALGAVYVDFVTSNTTGGEGFAVGDTITISDNLFGNEGAADVVLTVTDIALASVSLDVNASVTGSGSPTLSYQWQTQAPSGTRWTNITGAITDQVTIDDLTFADNGRKYRVKINSSNGAKEVISDTAVLQVRSASFYWND